MSKKTKIKSCDIVENVEKLPQQDTVDMTQQEAREYLEKIIKGEITLKGLEKKIASSFVEGTGTMQRVTKKIQQLKNDLKNGEQLSFELTGRIDENAKLLIMAENERR